MGVRPAGGLGLYLQTSLEASLLVPELGLPYAGVWTIEIPSYQLFLCPPSPRSPFSTSQQSEPLKVTLATPLPCSNCL